MKRALALLAPLALAAGLVACGDDDDDSPDTTEAVTSTPATDDAVEVTTTTDTASDDTDDTADTGDSVESGSASETLQEVFPNLSGDQIDCLVDELGDNPDPTEAQAAADACDIDPADLVPDMSAISVPDLSGVSIPENMGEMMQQVFPNLDDEQIDCLVDELGSDFDLSKAADLADTCNIDPADLQPGG